MARFIHSMSTYYSVFYASFYGILLIAGGCLWFCAVLCGMVRVTSCGKRHWQVLQASWSGGSRVLCADLEAESGALAPGGVITPPLTVLQRIRRRWGNWVRREAGVGLSSGKLARQSPWQSGKGISTRISGKNSYLTAHNLKKKRQLKGQVRMDHWSQ